MIAPVVVVGAGMAGVACARELIAAGVPVQVRERGRVVGGRIASTPWPSPAYGRVVDTGASYITARSDEFRLVVEDWVRRGLAKPWTDRFHVIDDGGLTGPVPGPMRYAAPAGLRCLVEDLARDLPILLNTPVRAIRPGPVVDGTPAAAVVLAIPDPLARQVLHPALHRECEATDRRWLPVLALTAHFERRSWPADLDGVFVNGDGVLAWIADDGRRRGDGAPVLVAHSTPAFALGRVAHPAPSSGELVAALRRLLQVPSPQVSAVHRWRYARPQLERDSTFHLTDSLVGLAGCGWGSPRVETAFLSGRALGQALAARLAASAPRTLPS